MMASLVPGLVEELLTAGDDLKRRDVASEIGELLYRDGERLESLSPLFEAGPVEPWVWLTAILEEHSHRSADFDGWLDVLVESTDLRIRARANRCVLELAIDEHLVRVARTVDMLATSVEEVELVDLALYLVHRSTDDLNRLAASVGSPARDLIQLALGGDDVRAGPSYIRDLGAVISVGRMSGGEVVLVLDEMAGRFTGASRSVAGLLAQQRRAWLSGTSREND